MNTLTAHNMTSPTPAALDAVQSLLTRTVDAEAGFQKMGDKAETSFLPIVERFRALHHSHANVLAAILSSHGRTADRGGSLMGDVNKAVVSLRAVFDRIDAGSFSAIADGEDYVFSAFDEAVQHALPIADATSLQAMKAELQRLLVNTGTVA